MPATYGYPAVSRTIFVALALILGLCVTVGPASAGKPTPPKKTTTYSVNLKVDGRTVVGPFSSTETVTAEIQANPVGDSADPTAWQGEATLNYGPIENTGLPQGCMLTNTPPTGTIKVAITKNGESVDVVWSTNSTPVGAALLTCQGYPAPGIGAPAAEPFVLLEPKEFTIAAAGGTQQLSGKLSSDKGIIENTGTMTVTQRVECGQKVKQVNTYPPGQQTSASSMVGKGFAVGEKVTADTKVEFVFDDGSVVRLDKGASIKETPDCAAFTDKSKSFKGTLLLGKVWGLFTEAFFGKREIDFSCPGGRCGGGVRGTEFWILPGKKQTTLSVAKGEVWISRLSKKDKLVGKKVTVTKGHTAVITKNKMTVRKLKPKKDRFPFGAK